jgi:hypothetical protein
MYRKKSSPVPQSIQILRYGRMSVLTHEGLVFGQRAARLPAQSDKAFGRTQDRDGLSTVGNQSRRSRLSSRADQFSRCLMKLFNG